MATIQDIIDYVSKTPHNTNPNVLRSMLNSISEDSEANDFIIMPETTFEFTTGEHGLQSSYPLSELIEPSDGSMDNVYVIIDGTEYPLEFGTGDGMSGFANNDESIILIFNEETENLDIYLNPEAFSEDSHLIKMIQKQTSSEEFPTTPVIINNIEYNSSTQEYTSQFSFEELSYYYDSSNYDILIQYDGDISYCFMDNNKFCTDAPRYNISINSSNEVIVEPISSSGGGGGNISV